MLALACFGAAVVGRPEQGIIKAGFALPEMSESNVLLLWAITMEST